MQMYMMELVTKRGQAVERRGKSIEWSGRWGARMKREHGRSLQKSQF